METNKKSINLDFDYIAIVDLKRALSRIGRDARHMGTNIRTVSIKSSAVIINRLRLRCQLSSSVYV